MRGEANDEVPDEAVTVGYPVEFWKTVDLFKQVVDETRSPGKVVPAVLGDEDVLGGQLEDLLGVCELISMDVMQVSQALQDIGTDPCLAWPEMREGEVYHVVPHRAVLEHEQLPERPQDPLFNLLYGPFPRDESFYPLDEHDGVLSQAEPFECPRIFFTDINRAYLRTGCPCTTVRAFRPCCLPFTGLAGIYGVRVPATLAAVPVGHRAAGTASAPPGLDGYDPPVHVRYRGVGLCFLEGPPGPSGFPQGKKGMRWRLHLPGL